MTSATARTRPAVRRAPRSSAGARVPAEVLPVARVLVDVSLAHLDRPYDYLVSEPDSATAQPGVRVRVRFAGRLVNGYIVERLDVSEHPGRLGFVERVISAEPVLSAEIAELTRAVADRYAGSLADVLRLAVPPRHAKTENALTARTVDEMPAPAEATNGGLDGVGTGPLPVTEPRPVPIQPQSGSVTQVPAAPPEDPDGSRGVAPVAAGRGGGSDAGWSRYPAGAAFLAAIRERRPARAVWQALPGEDWPARLAEAAVAAARSGHGSLLIVPDARDLARLDSALTELDGEPHVTLSADLGPAERYRRFLRISRGEVRVVAGTRAAVFAPVADLGLVAIFDDGDDLFAEPRAPYPHAREVLMLRSAARSCALLVGGFARTAEAELLVSSGWAKPIEASRAVVRRCAPRMSAAGEEYAVGADSAAASARLSPAAFAAARESLDAGAPVLVQVPRRGYLPVVACSRCRRRAECRHCRGPLALTGRSGLPGCRWCGIPEAHFRCGACGSDSLRAVSIGAGRTAEEVGRAFPGAPVINSSGPKVRATVPAAAALVVATPGAEPVVDGGYGAALLLDGAAMLARPDLRATEETLRRWMAAATLVRSAAEGGRVVIGADASLPVVQALIRWDPVGHAGAELAARRELRFPPVTAMASIEGDDVTVLGVLDRLEVPTDGEVLGPVALSDLEGDDAPSHRAADGTAEDLPKLRALIRVPQAQRKALSLALQVVASARSARKEGGGVRIRVDPPDLF